jgi:hypothetical protein
MLFALSDSLAVEALSNDLVLGRVLRMDYLVVLIRQPVFVLR